MQAHEQRVVDELNALETKIGKLGTFVDKRSPDVDVQDMKLLVLQLGVMKTYAEILRQRIHRFTI